MALEALADMLTDWVKIGSRFSNAVVQALMVLMGHRPPMVSCALSYLSCREQNTRHDLMCENRVDGCSF